MAIGRPAKFDNPEDLITKIDEYFETKDQKKWTITGLALFLGFESRQSFYDYEEKGDFSYIIKRARLHVEMSYEEKLSENNATGSIFALKNMGWRDKSETALTDGEGKNVFAGLTVKVIHTQKNDG